MHWLLYFRLFTLTAGTLLPFFWMVVILGHRRQRNFERIFFFLCLALTCFFGCSLLQLNAELYYGSVRTGLLRFAWTFLCLGLWFAPPLIVHLHSQYASLHGAIDSPRIKRLWLVAAYAPTILLLPQLVSALRLPPQQVDFVRPTHVLGLPFQVWLVLTIAVAAFWQRRFSQLAESKDERSLYLTLKWQFVALAGLLAASAFLQQRFKPDFMALLGPVLLVATICGPFLKIIEQVNRFNFLAIGRQRNLVYAVFAVFIALLYLSFVRRAGQWLEPLLPPEATAALLLFLPVVFFEPLQRLVRGLLQVTAQREMDRISPLAIQVHSEARRGDLRVLISFIENLVRTKLQFQDVWIQILEPPIDLPANKRGTHSGEESFSLYRPGRLNGVITVRPHGAMVSGESLGAMRFLAESIAGAIDTCIVLQEKLELERELAERERMALVGQMAASISHNLKNPLGSMKTILQVQMESTEMPASMRGETQMVLDEINRLSARLNQLLQFSRPGVRAANKNERCNVVAVTRNVVDVLRHEAEPGGVGLNFAAANGTYEVAATGEAVNDVLSNVVLNAIEAAGRGGHVCVGLQCENGSCTVAIEDDGPGVPDKLRDKILAPFFTTKARGTGLGLAIVARRLEEIGGELLIDSPIREDRGSRFRVILPLAPKESAS